MPISLIKEEQEHFLRVLPILLKKDEQFRGSLYTILSESFVKKDDFSELKGIVKELGIKVSDLAEAQKRTETKVEELAEAQKRTETKVEELAEAQKRTETKVEELAEAQKRTETKVEKLVEAQKNTWTEVKKLSDSIGFGLEDVARVVLPGYLKRHLNIDIDEFERRFLFVGKREVEINLYGEGRQNENEVIILGESKGRIYKREIKRFVKDIKSLEKALQKPYIKLMFGFFIHPSAQEIAKEEEIFLITSYQR
ncbi:MAG: hypothetical protein AB1630_08560 [bacterium]